MQNKDSQPRPASAEDISTYNLIQEYYADVHGIQSDMIYARDDGEEFLPSSVFSEEVKNSLDTGIAALKDFHNKISEIDINEITNPEARESLKELKQSLDTNIDAYVKTIDLYNQYYNDSDYKKDATYNQHYDYDEDGTIIKQIFSTYTTNEDFDSIMYGEIMDDIIWELKNVIEK